ncbi:Site-specific DNA recombinase [Albimonas pacifica]|uniref:Site-specific DNA recombinase n=1 Tax=Albimonas pacifica TaxID=1114924 RepID=A0A1I3PN28_9RHOB|nr:Site-specific DNA recombinase [Albimonas pacifica]
MVLQGTEGDSAVKSYVIYKRVSTEEQGRSGLGLEAQDRDIELYLSTYSDVPYEVIGTFTDVLSGANDGRPELEKAIALARSTGAELLVAKLDRLSRKVSFIASLMDDKKLALRVASMPHADKFQLHIYAALAEQERDFISTRTKAALAAAKARGVKLGGLRPNTERRNEALRAGALDRAKRVEKFVRPLHAEGKSLRDIAELMNAAGIPTARGGNWQASQVKRVLDRLATVA